MAWQVNRPKWTTLTGVRGDSGRAGQTEARPKTALGRGRALADRVLRVARFRGSRRAAPGPRHMYVYVYMYIFISIYLYIYISTCVYVYVYVCIYIYRSMYI